MEALLSLRGNPHLACPVIHLAGTNGKGSTLAHLRSLLEAKGLRVGVFSSPYLVSFHEQISINGLPISDQDLETYLSLYQDLLAKNSSDQTLLGLTEFELMTVLAFDYFAAENPDVVILEVGMGGRLDSTNVCQPMLTAITTIGREGGNHQGKDSGLARPDGIGSSRSHCAAGELLIGTSRAVRQGLFS